MNAPAFAFDNSYARDLGDGFAVPWPPARAPAPQLLFLNGELSNELGLPLSSLPDEDAAALLSGNALPPGAEPIAQAYAGHQFGGFSPQLGDGRALLLGEVIDRHGQRRDIAFKGSGRTPFSRGGDGKAAVGPMLREVLIGEAMHALGVPTTRALAVVATGEAVFREEALPGAVLTRVAASHLRVGTFQYFAARQDHGRLQRLADYAMTRHDPDLADLPAGERCLGLLQAVARRQAALLAQWMNLGFIHGVMNTDNMTISGETIDYGPCAFMEAFNPETVFSSIDRGGRYAFANQPPIAQWNLARLAEALLPLIDADADRAVERATSVLDAFGEDHRAAWRRGQQAKLGVLVLDPDAPQADADAALADDWLSLLQQHRVDFTLAWRHLADAAAGHEAPLRALFPEPAALEPWLQRWRERCAEQDRRHGVEAGFTSAARADAMRRLSPWIIPRNHRVEAALAAATEGNLQPFERLLTALRRPFESHPEDAGYAEPAPASLTAAYRTFCGT